MKLLKPDFWNQKNSFCSLLLLPLTYFVLIFLFLKKKIIVPKKFKIPIICVGNIYVGGTGKTPLSILITKKFQSKKKTVIIKKYYKNHIDEQRLINSKAEFLILNPDRKKALEEAEKKFELAVLDDGFQDLSIKKEVNILCFNSKQLIGNEMVMPSGPLRDSLNRINDAQIIVINGNKNKEFEKKIHKISKNVEVYYSKYIAKNINNFREKKLFAFSGIGNPENFFDLLKTNNLDLHKTSIYPDHYQFSKKELNNILKFAMKNNLEPITTEKDHYRIKDFGFKEIKFLETELNISDEEKFFKKIESYL